MPIRQESIIYLAGGCFWGIEGYFRQITGVTATEVGYANGRTPEARYETLPETGHAEVLKLSYQPTEIHLAELLTHFFRIIDPTLLNRQGNDRGTQYRTGIYYTAAEQKQVAAIALEVEAKQYREPLVVELEPLQNYTPAEDLHQNYLEKNPGGYCHIRLQTASEPLYPEFPKADPAELAIRLSPLEYRVTQQAGTEPPGSSPHNHLSRSGIYVDISNGRPLFSTDDQYDAGCGWPSFTMPITTDALTYAEDRSHGMLRTEVRSQGTDSHLGHVFGDGPVATGGLRYCINGAALRFIPREQMENTPYEAYLPYVTAEQPG
jgi:peptide methionine sulfoxide reductase msrA/msrB